MHAVIFLGFMSLLVRKLQLHRHRLRRVRRPIPGSLADCSPRFKDVVELAVLCGLRLRVLSAASC